MGWTLERDGGAQRTSPKFLVSLIFLISKSVACKCILYQLTFLSSSPSNWHARATRGRENPISLMCFTRFWAAGLRSLKGFSSSDFTAGLLAERLVTDGDFLVSGRDCSGLSNSGHGFQFYATDTKIIIPNSSTMFSTYNYIPLHKVFCITTVLLNFQQSNCNRIKMQFHKQVQMFLKNLLPQASAK